MTERIALREVGRGGDRDPRMAWELPGGGHVLFTSREDGNLSSVGGDGAELGAAARERLRERIGVERLARGYQVHGTTVRVVEDEEEKRLGGGGAAGHVGKGATGEQEGGQAAVEVGRGGGAIRADGQATARRAVGVMVLSADCLPVALGMEGAVAMVHAGWRGLAAGVLQEGVRALRGLGAGGDVVAVIGPGAGLCCYEVGEEVFAAVEGRGRQSGTVSPERAAGARGRGRLIDLKALARERLLAAGVAEVHDVGACTICDERFFSYRREGDRAGRQGGVAWLG